MTKRKFKLTRYTKAIVAFLTPVLTGVAAALLEDPFTWTHVGYVAISSALTAMVVWSTPNAE